MNGKNGSLVSVADGLVSVAVSVPGSAGEGERHIRGRLT